jgi:hypothetical protein
MALYDKWAFVEKDLDQKHWFIKLTGGDYGGVIYRYTDVKLLPDSESISFDYEIVEHYGDDPKGQVEFNTAVGDILKCVLHDAMEAQDYVLGKNKNE